MKKFFENSKAFAAIMAAVIKDGGDENEISASEFARMHMKKFFVLAAAIIILAASCGSSDDKIFGITPKEFMRRYNENLASTSANYDVFKINTVKSNNNVWTFYNDKSYLFVISAERGKGWTITTFHGTENLPFVTALLLSSLESDKVASQETYLSNISLAYELIKYPTSRFEGNDIIYEKRTEYTGHMYNFSLLIERDKLGRVTNSTGFLTIEIK